MRPAGPVPRVTIVVISKDDPDGLARTLRSIERQDLADHEVVLVTKGTSSRIATGGFALPALRHVRQESRGISRAFNEGLACARAPWVNFLNGGDEYAHPHVLRRVAPLLDDGADIVTGRAREVKFGVTIPRSWSWEARDRELISHQASFFRAELFARLGGYSPDFSVRMDLEWMLRTPATTRVRWLDEELVVFEGGGVSTMSPWRSSVEELSALRLHRRSPARIARLVAVQLPFRLARAALRETRAHLPRRRAGEPVKDRDA
jgi:glycosyltransferase involved in cell wall biosynthesis